MAARPERRARETRRAEPPQGFPPFAPRSTTGGEIRFAGSTLRLSRLGIARRLRRRFAVSLPAVANTDAEMRATVANLVTPHLLRVVDFARQAEAGGNIEWHLRDAVARTIDALGHQYNARELLSTYVEGLEAAARDKGRVHSAYSRTLQAAASQATQHLAKL